MSPTDRGLSLASRITGGLKDTTPTARAARMALTLSQVIQVSRPLHLRRDSLGVVGSQASSRVGEGWSIMECRSARHACSSPERLDDTMKTPTTILLGAVFCCLALRAELCAS